MQCPDCGAYIGDEDLFCGECGRPVSTPPAAGTGKSEAATKVEPAVKPPPRPPAAVPAAPTTAPSTRQRALILGLVGGAAGLMTLCIAGFIFLFALQAGNEPTPTPEPTLAPEPTIAPEPTSALISPPTKYSPGAIVYSEGFDTDDGGWDVYDEDDTWAAYVDGGYRLGVRVSNYVTWANPTLDESFANFEIEVDTRQVEGSIDDNLGVLVRYQADDENYYWFQISNDGFYSVSMLRGGEWATLVDWNTSDAIQTGLDVVNHIKVVCYRDEFDFYVNGTYLTSVTDGTFATGNIGLAAGTFEEAGVVIEFDNLTVNLLDE